MQSNHYKIKPIIEREQELNKLKELFKEEQPYILVSGASGLGKTQLVLNAISDNENIIYTKFDLAEQSIPLATLLNSFTYFINTNSTKLHPDISNKIYLHFICFFDLQSKLRIIWSRKWFLQQG